jgi:hypothetical protein
MEEQSWVNGELTEWERDLLAMDMSGVPVRSTTEDENTAGE